MSADPDQAYLFATPAQWQACLFSGAAHGAPAAMEGLTPRAPYARQPRVHTSPGAAAPAFTPAGEIIWHGKHALFRAMPSDAAAEHAAAPWAIARSPRLVATCDALWALGGENGTLECFELDSLTRRQVLHIPDATILDFAADTRGTILVLIERDATRQIVALGCDGEIHDLTALDDSLSPSRIAHLIPKGVILLLARDGSLLLALARSSGKLLWTRQLAAFRPCFAATELSSDGRGGIFLAGADGAESGGQAALLVLDGEANRVDSILLARPATGVTGARGYLAVTDAEGIAIFNTSAIAGDSAAAEMEIITPMLTAPGTDAALPWQRVEAWARLPTGTTLDLRFGWSEDPGFASRAAKFFADTGLPQSQRLEWLRDALDHWSTQISFAGSEDRARNDPLAPPIAFPLHDARSRTLWIHLRMRATPGSELPELTRLRVSYAPNAMLEQLPAVFRKTAYDSGDFLGVLVGALEASSQDLDRRIGNLGALIHPDTASARWLDELAEWLGLPWDDALTLSQKRAIARNAAALAAKRGTREGLAVLLDSLFPGSPPRFRITDVDVDFGFAILGGGRAGCGTMLPAVLAGLPRSATVLSRKTILGQARLPCGGAGPSATRHLTGSLRIDLFVGPEERNAAGKWLPRMLDAVLPANLRLALDWRTRAPGAEPGDEYLASAPSPHLGRDAIVGLAHFPTGRAPTFWSGG